MQHGVEGHLLFALPALLHGLDVRRRDQRVAVEDRAIGVLDRRVVVGAHVATELALPLADEQLDLVLVAEVRAFLVVVRRREPEVFAEGLVLVLGALGIEVQPEPRVELVLGRLEAAELLLEAFELLLQLLALLLVVGHVIGAQARGDAEVGCLDEEHVDPAHVHLQRLGVLASAPRAVAEAHVAELLHQLVLAGGVGVLLLELLHALLLAVLLRWGRGEAGRRGPERGEQDQGEGASCVQHLGCGAWVLWNEEGGEHRGAHRPLVSVRGTDVTAQRLATSASFLAFASSRWRLSSIL